MLLGVDVGGTFTDAVLLASDGAVHTAKVPSTPSQEQRGVLDAIAAVLERAGAGPLEVRRFAHGMTVATNALLEGRTARTALVATEGFTDVIELGRQNRPHLYRLCESAPPPLVAAELRFAAPERVGPDGPLRALSVLAAGELADAIATTAPEAVAVALLHSYLDPAHERLLGAALRERLPAASVSLSSELVGTFREFERTATTAIDASLSPRLGSYLDGLREETTRLGLAEPQIMQSSGGLTDAGRAGRHAALTVLSGPAGGVAGARLVAELAGERDVACFDMGGTSCDVCLIAGGQVPETSERVIAGRPVTLPALDIHTVGAGGGSIAWRDAGGALRVGPASAGAEPGPACYGRGGEEPTVTDANLVLGRLLADAPLAGDVRLDAAAAERAVRRLGQELGLDLHACAEGIVRVAEAEMLAALRVVTVERGIDPRAFALMPFGGAGGLHAAALADGLGISRVLCPRASGVLSALGLAAAPPRRDAARTVMLAGAELDGPALEQARGELLAEASAALGEQPRRARVRHELRYRGQSFELPVDEERSDEERAMSAQQLRAAFAGAHEERYGYRDEAAGVELVNLRASVWGPAPSMLPRAVAGRRPARERGGFVLGGERVEAEVVRGQPEPGDRLQGPALVALPESTLLVAPGWSASVDEQGTITMRKSPGG
ncbi:MAG TPA: hydantoinase/oxoprolinase family protein [Solirubrobacteraceae bacterium]|jgi:N-methylhydantoinase A|nr:hydantoinase/oxoprolinase family protein [Solirubrobacteraceae bacterium]